MLETILTIGFIALMIARIEPKPRTRTRKPQVSFKLVSSDCKGYNSK